MKILDFFLFLWVIVALLDPDPDPATQINADPCGYPYTDPDPNPVEHSKGTQTVPASSQRLTPQRRPFFLGGGGDKGCTTEKSLRAILDFLKNGSYILFFILI
jgi:hypothetical protein